MNPETAIFGQRYRCFREGAVIGEGTYEDSEEIGPAFLSMFVDGNLVNDVLIPDQIELL